LKEGGSDKNNDCLINCIKKCVQRGAAKIDAADIKQHLGLKRNDMISIDHLPKLEKYINYLLGVNQYAINVTGDYNYKSNVPTNKIIRLILSKNHYSLDTDEIKSQNASYKEKPFLMSHTEDYKEYTVYDGELIRTIDKEQYNKYKSFESKYTVINKNFCDDAKKWDIKQSFKSFVEMTEILKEKTHGRINFYKTGYFKQSALKYFYELNAAVQPDEIDDEDNIKWINDASFAALAYWQPYIGECDIYDINSHYPNILRKNYHYFPIKDGEFKILSNQEFEEIIKKPTPDYGIYKCKISKKPNHLKPTKFFRFNTRDKYTHLDIACAVQYDLQIDLIQDGKPNFLYFSKDKLMNGAFLFKKYVEEFYNLKMEGVQGAKALLNILW
ncbi:MAG: hypothetical protein ACK5XN_04285, partial [Bacteroidota bacterium]